MDVASIVVNAIVKALGYILSVVVIAGKPVLVSLYNNYISPNLLNPAMSFPNIVNGTIGSGVSSLYYFVMFYLYDPIITIILAALGLLILVNSSLNLRQSFRHIWIRILLVLILSNISFFIVQDILFLGSLLYSPLWYYGLPKHSFSNGYSLLAGLEIGGKAGTIVSVMVLGIFVFLMLFLLLYLSFRLAIMYTFPILMPIFTLFLLIPQTKRLGEKVWSIFIENLIAPILMSIPLILCTYVKNNSVLVLGFLGLADAMPILLSGPANSRVSGLFLGQSVSKGMNTSLNGARSPLRNSTKRVTQSLSTLTSKEKIRNQPQIGSKRQFSTMDDEKGIENSMFFRVK